MDQRAGQLVLSPAGAEMMTLIKHVRRQWMEELFAQWGDTDRDTLVALMSKMMGQELNFKGLGASKSPMASG